MKTTLLFAVISIFILLLIGMSFYHIVEGWDYIDAFYFAGLTLTTVGHPNLIPANPISKLFTVAYSLAGIAVVFLVFLSSIRLYLDREKLRIRRKLDTYRNLLGRKKMKTKGKVKVVTG